MQFGLLILKSESRGSLTGLVVLVFNNILASPPFSGEAICREDICDFTGQALHDVNYLSVANIYFSFYFLVSLVLLSS